MDPANDWNQTLTLQEKIMKHSLVALSLGLGGAVLLATDAPAQSTGRNCADHPTVVARLASAYGESRQSIGIGANNVVIEMFASKETGSWTITATVAGGSTCLVASGQAFELLAETLPNTDPGA
jgi:hypothetical protein